MRVYIYISTDMGGILEAFLDRGNDTKILYEKKLNSPPCLWRGDERWELRKIGLLDTE